MKSSILEKRAELRTVYTSGMVIRLSDQLVKDLEVYQLAEILEGFDRAFGDGYRQGESTGEINGARSVLRAVKENKKEIEI